MQKKLTYGQKISMVAAAPVLGLSSSVDAAVVYKNPTDIGITSSAFGSVGWDIDGDGTNEFTLTGKKDLINISAGASAGLRARAYGTLNLPSGDSISDSKLLIKTKILRAFGRTTQQFRTYSGTNTDTNYNFLNGFNPDEEGHLGFQFNVGDNLHYGWASITIGYASLKIHDWAYNDVAGQSISVGDTGAAPVPLPPSAHLMLLALGAGGLTQWRSRRKAQESSQASA